MIVIGSLPASLRGVTLPRKPADVDLVGTRAELDAFRAANAAHIASESHAHGHRARFVLHPGREWKSIEFDYEEADSDRMLAALCTADTTRILESEVQLPSVNVLYLTKRAHAAVPLNVEKTILHMKLLKAAVTPFSAEELEYYETRRKECEGRLEKHPARFSLDVSNEEFFALSNHVRIYEHDDLHEAIAFTRGKPLYERCKHNLDSAKIERDLFLAMPKDDQIRMVQEEFIVVGLERFYMHDRSLPLARVYWLGMIKTIRDLFAGWFKNYCLDNVDRLVVDPPYDFVSRFEQAERNGELRLLEQQADGPAGEIEVAVRLFAANRLADAELRFLALAKQDDPQVRRQALFHLGAIARRRRQNEIATHWFRRTVEADPQFFVARNELGNAHFAAGRAEDAMACYQGVVREQPKFAAAWVNLGYVLESLGRRADAVEAYREGLRNRGGDPVLQQRLQQALAAGTSGAAPIAQPA